MRLSRRDFWSLTMAEFWAVYDGIFGAAQEPMTRSKYEEMKQKDAERTALRALKTRGEKA